MRRLREAEARGSYIRTDLTLRTPIEEARDAICVKSGISLLPCMLPDPRE